MGTHRWNEFSLARFLVVLVLHEPWIYPSTALPIPAPDISVCHLPFYLPDGETPFDCCAPTSERPAIDFQLNQSSQAPLRVRRPAHLLDQEYIQKLRLGYELMKALPPEDPRSFRQQANIHCAYCNSVYLERNTSVSYEIHDSWLFFSFHRWYIYFHERILGRLLGDETFALPFWNYDNPAGASMPQMYVDFPELTDELRQQSHLRPPAVVIFDYPATPNGTERSPEAQLEVNRRIMYNVMISGATTQFSFFGEPLRRGEEVMPGKGTVEQAPHNVVHGWTGDYQVLGWKDMGSFYAAARDPVFYAHHSSLDRLWDVWKTLAPQNRDIDDPDYLESGFAFYNEDAELVDVKVKDSLDSSKLGYTYEEVDNVWLDAKPTPLSNGTAVLAANATLCVLGDVLSEPCSLLVTRSPEAAIGVEELLALLDIDVQIGNDQARFEVFVNLPSANETTTLACTEYAGSFSMLPRFAVSSSDNHIRTSLRLATVGFIVNELGLIAEESLVVTIVPRPGSPFSISSVNMEYQASLTLSSFQ